MAEHVGRKLTETQETAAESGITGDYAGEFVIFLDVDGVLNCVATSERIFQCIGIDPEKVKILKQLRDMFDARIILVSSWKDGWEADPGECDDFGVYLTDRLQEARLTIAGKTADHGDDRGAGICRWMVSHGPLRGFLILDDERFDYKTCGIARHWLQTSYFGSRGGLQEKHLAYIRKRKQLFEIK